MSNLNVIGSSMKDGVQADVFHVTHSLSGMLGMYLNIQHTYYRSNPLASNYLHMLHVSIASPILHAYVKG